MYNMSKFAMSLNDSEVRNYDLPPTDSRFRPDIRCLENGDIGRWPQTAKYGNVR